MSNERIYGLHAVAARLRHADSGRLYIVQQRNSRRLRDIEAAARAVGVEVIIATGAELDALVGDASAHQGVVFETRKQQPLAEATIREVLAKPGTGRLYLLLDGVTDPGNLGACLRSAATAGALAVIAPRDKSAPLNADAIKRASGGAELVPYIRVANLARTMKELQEAGVWLVGTTLDAPVDIAAVDLSGDIALVMGSEGSGIRRRTAETCDFLASIPMQNPDLGFNVSVATGICLYEVMRQRRLST